ncbi:MAG: aldehyde dehydrogenase family protein [Acidimicrobiia bacterium]
MSVTAPVGKETLAFIEKPHQLLIDGAWVDAASGQTFDTVDPATEEVLAKISYGGPVDVDRAVTAARRAFTEGAWPKMTPSERARILLRVADILETRTDEFAEVEALDNGKPFTVAKFADLALVIDFLRYMAGSATRIEGKTITPSIPYMPGAEFLAYTRKEPVGVVGQIIPWNFPLLMAAWKVAPAIAAGCTVLLKPAEQTPLTALMLGEAFLEAGLPAGVLNIIPGFGDTGAAISAHPGVDKVAFTGSTEVGKLIVQAAVGNLKKVTLELGGKSPVVVYQDADMEAAVAGVTNAIFFNSGQVCTAGSRLYVEEGAFDDLVAGVAEQAKKINVGSAFEPESQIGPLVSAEQFEKVQGYLASGREEGASALSGGGRQGTKGYFIEPTVLKNVTPDMKVVREEIFGPVLTAMPFKSTDEIMASANDTSYGLAASVWTKDITKAHRAAGALKAGTVWVNTYHVDGAGLPFGGYKQSGWGREQGHEVLENYLETKSVIVGL